MEKIQNKLIELFKIGVYSFAIFGVVIFLAYILVLNVPEREYIPMAAINQLLCYIGGATISLTLCLSDIFFEKIPLKIRIVMFFILLYIMGIIYFQFNAPLDIFSSIRYFIALSIWIIYMSLLVLISWFVYSYVINNKYNKCLKTYKEKLSNNVNKKGGEI